VTEVKEGGEQEDSRFSIDVMEEKVRGETKGNQKERRRKRTEDGKPAGRAGSAGIMAAEDGQLDFGGARIFAPNPCFTLSSSKYRQAHWAWGTMSNLKDKRSF